MDRWFVVIAAVTGFLGVAAGSFEAHVVATGSGADLRATFETGVQYQMYHVPALLAVAWLCSRKPSVLAEWSGWVLLAGIISFSGSLYAYAMTTAEIFGYIAAGGAIVLMIGWLMLAVAALPLSLAGPATA